MAAHWEDILTKLGQIEEHARLTLEEFPKLAKERQRMIVAICRLLRSEIERAQGPASEKG